MVVVWWFWRCGKARAGVRVVMWRCGGVEVVRVEKGSMVVLTTMVVLEGWWWRQWR